MRAGNLLMSFTCRILVQGPNHSMICCLTNPLHQMGWSQGYLSGYPAYSGLFLDKPKSDDRFQKWTSNSGGPVFKLSLDRFGCLVLSLLLDYKCNERLRKGSPHGFNLAPSSLKSPLKSLDPSLLCSEDLQPQRSESLFLGAISYFHPIGPCTPQGSHPLGGTSTG